MKDYKAEIDYKDVDFNADVVAYSCLRERMVTSFEKYFGPVDLPVADLNAEQHTP